MSIRDWPAAERPREKLIQHGAAALSEAELLAILIRTGRRGASAVDLARQALTAFGGLRAVLAAPAAQFCGQPGLTLARYAQVQAALELARRHYRETLTSGPGLNSPRAAQDFLVARLRDRPHEVFCCLHLDNRHRLIAFDELFNGTIDGAIVYPREVVKQALARNAAALIVAHNHPSGVAEPSAADEQVTRRLKAALALVDIQLIDHLVIGDGQCVSFAERGLL